MGEVTPAARRVLVVTRSTELHAGAGGMERVAGHLVAALRDAGWRVGLLTTPWGSVGSDERRSHLADVVWTAGDRPGRYSTAWWVATARSGPWTAWAPDLVVSVGDGAAAMILRRRGVPSVVQAHGSFRSELASSVRARTLRESLKVPLHVARLPLRRAALRRATRVWAITDRVAADLVRFPVGVAAQRVSVLANGVPSEAAGTATATATGTGTGTGSGRASERARLGLGPDAVGILFAGRVHEQKGLDLALRALTLAPVDQRLVVAGDGPARGALQRLAGELGVQDRVRWLGHVPADELRRVMAAADVLVVPSLRVEGQPLVALEAAAQGLPVVATANARLGPDLEQDGCVRIVAAGPAELAGGVADVVRARASHPRRPYLPEGSGLAAAARRYVAAAAEVAGRPPVPVAEGAR